MQDTKLPGEDEAFYDSALPSPRVHALIGREQDLARIKQRLYEGGRAALTVLHGLPGVGKTALAIALAHDPDIRAHFSGGVLWAGLGPNPNISGLLSRWAELLGLSPTEWARLSDLQAKASAIRNAIGSRKMIVIIDDVWQYEDVQALRVGAQDCAHLVTTRHRAIAAQITPNAVMISELNPIQSVLLLNQAMQGDGQGQDQDVTGGTGDRKGRDGVNPSSTLRDGDAPGESKDRDGEELSGVGILGKETDPRRDRGFPRSSDPFPHEKPLSAPANHTLAGSPEALSLRPSKYLPLRDGDEGLAPALAQKIQDVVQTVGGLPLALTLLGNYLRKQAQHSDESISAALERLSNAHIRLEITEAPTHPIEDQPGLSDDAQPSLQSVIAITDQWLPELARKALYTLSIFPPKPQIFTEETALAVTACTYNELDLLNDVGLLESYGDLCTLHQVISDYARLHLDETEECAAYSRLITYTANYVEAHKKDYNLLDIQSPTIYLALTQAHAQGKHSELIRTVCAFAPFLILRGFYQEAECHLHLANQAARTLNDNNAITTTLLYLGEIEQRLGNYPQAAISLQEGLTLARQMNNQERIYALLTQLGIVLQEQGKFQEAETAYQEGLTLARNIADHESTCLLLNNLGSLNMRRGEFAQSESYLQEGLILARNIEDRERVSGLLRILGAVEIYRGNFVQAQSYLQEGLPIARQLGDREHICTCLINLGLVAAQQGKNAQAKMSYQEGLELAQQIGHRDRICSLLINLGDVFVEEGNYVQAEICLQEGLELARQIGHREWISIFLLNLGMIAHKQGYYNKSESYLQESLALVSQVDRPDIICQILYELGDLSLSEGSSGSADAYFKKMLEQIPSGGQELLAFAYYGLARVCVLQEDRETAVLYSSKSIAIFETMGHRKISEVKEWIKATLS